MCGITGWVNFSRDLRNNADVIKDMRDSLTHRGPDESGLFTGKNVLFGHRRLTVVDPTGGHQPMTKNKGGYQYTIIYNGELYNTEDLREKLIKKGYRFAAYSDTEVLLTSYLEFGENCVDHLNGIYAFAIWNEKKQQIYIARDRLGVKPLFYYHKNNEFIFGSEIKSILAHPGVKPIIGEEGLLEIFGLGPARSPGSGVFKDINELRPGHFLTFSKKQLDVKRYWQLQSKIHPDSYQTTVAKIRNLFLDTVNRQLISDVPLCTFLSGGLDSTAISAVAAQQMRKKGNILNTYSIDYQDNDNYFKKNDFQPDADSKWIPRVSEAIASKHHYYNINNSELVASLRDAVIANDLPGMADIDSSLYLFTKNVKNNFTVALSGECADEIFGGYPWFRNSEDINADIFPWSKSLALRKYILSDKIDDNSLEEFVRSKYQATINEVPLRDDETEKESKMRELFYLNMKWFMLTLLTRKDRMSMANSLEVRVPFADHRLVEYSWNIPWEMKYHNKIEKGLLRDAFKGIVPEIVLNRRKSPYPRTYHPKYGKLIREWISEIIYDSSSPILKLINKNHIINIIENQNKELNEPWFGQLMRDNQLLAYLIQVNIWLEYYQVQIDF